MQKFRQ